MSDNGFIGPPFIQVPGVPNFRDIGGYPITSSAGKVVRTGLVFRSSEPSKVDDQGIVKLQALGIKDVYDLRSRLELVRDAQNGNGRQARTWPGATRVVAPVFSDSEYTPEAIAARFRMYATDTTTPIVLAHLREILKAAAAEDNPDRPYRSILQHFASNSTGGPYPILIHCSAGKDRTGVICALILSLCGVEDEAVAHEYSLSELGLKSRPEFLRNLLQEPVVKGNAAAAMQMVGSRKRFMLALLRTMKEQWGSVDQCVIGLGLIDQDGVEQLRRNMVVDIDAVSGTELDWMSHAELVARAEDEADRRIDALVAAA
ncbi:hypothetical protein N8I77_013315 [Diaporthe amygdali]|uniref:Tyrosine specific protein phosphatases domain-containing protein n=1 Tax=Phomopsis amygdali TaxID=1214568 RepID=A0AAD9S411_PHOAM|nr:hypothetical protein N8I77_013315 [Diaporthe amygdali]